MQNKKREKGGKEKKETKYRTRQKTKQNNLTQNKAKYS